jgi:NTP pyrophosphatase (non-canonical NTP hydrolase)
MNAKKRMSVDSTFDLNHAIIGMMTELGEFADIQKKWVQYGKAEDWVNMCEELGDLMWYVAIASKVIEENMGVTLDDILEINIKKLRMRYPEKFTEKNAIERNVDEERPFLENECYHRGVDN